MKAVYGYDIKTKKYWYYIEIQGEEVNSARNLNKNELEKIKENNQMYRWYKETDFDI